MKQVFQDLRDGSTSVEEFPIPQLRPGHLLVRTGASLISAGTERMLAEFGRGSYLDKARQQPDKVRQTLDKARTDGVAQTLEAIRAKLGDPLPMGYANAGFVQAIGPDVHGFAIGQLVSSNGPHAEYVSVPATLAAAAGGSERPLAPEQAAFGTVGAIALQSVRLASPTLGERFAVIGLGLVGLLTVQLLRASGCHVIGIDPDANRVRLAETFGATGRITEGDVVEAAMEFTGGAGIDGVVIAASTTSNEPVHQAAAMSRKRGRVVLVGVTGLELRRADFYEKELTFQVSCSYGPGRYDPEYEDKARDYPFGFVRWTAARNQAAFLEMVADGRVDVAPLVSRRFDIEDAAKAYDTLVTDRAALGLVLTYPEAPRPGAAATTISVRPREAEPRARTGRRPTIGFVGAGAFSQRVLLPTLNDLEANLRTVASRTGASAGIAARRFGFDHATSDVGSVLQADDIDVVFITTRHDSHAALVREALDNGKHVFVEKPLAIDREELDRVCAAYSARDQAGPAPIVMVGFNRRFAPQIQEMRTLIGGQGPSAFTVTVNAGSVPPDSWLHDPSRGGGRIVGEACHFIDLLRFLAGHPIISCTSAVMAGRTPDTANIQLAFSDGSIGTVNYFANGHPGVPKERVEVYNRGRVLQLDNFRRLRGYGFGRLSQRRLLRQDKGHTAELEAFLTAVTRGGPSPIPFDEMVEVTEASLVAAEGLRAA